MGLPVNTTDYWMQGLGSYYGNEHDLRCCPVAAKPSSEVDPTSPFGGVYPDSTFIGWGIFPGPAPGEPSSAFNCVNTGD